MKKFRKITAAVLSAVMLAALTVSAVAETYDYENGNAAIGNTAAQDSYENPVTAFEAAYLKRLQQQFVDLKKEIAPNLHFDGEKLVLTNEQIIDGSLVVESTRITPDSANKSGTFSVSKDIYAGTDVSSGVIASMSLSAYFTWDADKKEVSVDANSVSARFTKKTSGDYPKLKQANTLVDNDGAFEPNIKYAAVTYAVEIEKSDGVTSQYAIGIAVNSEGAAIYPTLNFNS